jgi:hypothetical protein
MRASISAVGLWAGASALLFGSLVAPAGAVPINNGCGYTRSDSDLNGDGFDDAVVGDPYATVDGKREAGAIVVLFGDADGRIGEGKRRILTQASVPGSYVEAGDHFGWSVAIDDATMDLCADLLVGSPGEDWQGHKDAGIAHLISFAPDLEGGPGVPIAQLLSEATLGHDVEAGDEFGTSVAIADARGADEAAGAIGAPGEDVGSVTDAGAVIQFAAQYGDVAPGREVRQGDGRTPGRPDQGDRFGASLLVAALAVPGDDPGSVGYEWCFVSGAPGDLVNGRDGAGSVTVWGAEAPFADVVTQDSPAVDDVAEAGDQFGYSIAVNVSSGSPRGQVVVVGAPGEDVGAVRDAGSVTLLRSETPGLQGFVVFNQDSKGMPGAAEPGDRFGHSVAMRYGADQLLAVGIPGEDLLDVVDAGMVQPVAVPSVQLGEFHPLAPYTESSAGTPGSIGRGHQFGLALGAIRGRRETVLLVASPYAAAGSVFLVSERPGPTGSLTRFWVPGRDGVPKAQSPGRFGWSLGSLQSD